MAFLNVTAIKSALKQENLNPEIEEKLLQLQRYQEKRMKPELLPEREPRTIVVAVHSPSPPPGVRRRLQSSRLEDDDDWVDSSPRKRNRCTGRAPSPTPTVALAPATPAVPAPPPRVPHPPPPVAPVPTPAPSVPAPQAPSLDERRRIASNHSRMQILLFKHKELLKKDIIKKRGLLEKELGVEIQVGVDFQ